jgi:hypothetical protein
MIQLKVGDTWPPAKAALILGSTVIPLTGASVVFVVRTFRGKELFSKPAEVLNVATGEVQYQWEATDTAAAGKYVGQFIVTFADGRKTSAPNDSYIEVEILP